MDTALLAPEFDPMGTAIFDYYTHGKADKLRVFSSQFEEDEMPVKQLFRSYKEMSEIEKTALLAAKGRILDVGAGSGCHSLALQEMGKDVYAIDISPLAVKTMQMRGINEVSHMNLFSPQFTEKFDTILMLMNGTGIIGNLLSMPLFFEKMKQLLNENGSIILDSTDLRYLFEEEDGSFTIDLTDNYYGEIDFSMQYKKIKGQSFDWLYIDFQSLSLYASENGFKAKMLKEGTHYDYLTALSLR